MKCQCCGHEFTPRRSNQRYCGKKCRWKAHHLREGRRVKEYNRHYYVKNRDTLLLKAKVYYITGEWRLPT